MARKKTAKQQARRLLQEIESPDQLTCEQVRALLPAFVAAERAGEDVDSSPEYELLRRHLDSCEDCMALYAAIGEDLEALLGEEDVLPQVQLTPPSFFTPARESENIVLRVVEGLRRRFELSLMLPRLVPTGPTLSGGKRTVLFSDNLTEIPGAPLVSVSIDRDGQGPADLLVAVREASAATRWQIQLVTGDTTRSAITDERGIARFGQIAIENLSELTLSCSEVVE